MVVLSVYSMTRILSSTISVSCNLKVVPYCFVLSARLLPEMVLVKRSLLLVCYFGGSYDGNHILLHRHKNLQFLNYHLIVTRKFHCQRKKMMRIICQMLEKESPLLRRSQKESLPKKSQNKEFRQRKREMKMIR